MEDASTRRLPSAGAAAGFLLAAACAAAGLTVFAAFQYFPPTELAPRLENLYARGSVRLLLQVAPWTAGALLLLCGEAAWWARARAGHWPLALRRASRPLWPLALLAFAPWFDDPSGRQVVAAFLIGVSAYLAAPLASPALARLTGAVRRKPERAATALCLAWGLFLFAAAWRRYEAHWASLVDLGLFYELYDNARGTLLYSPTLGQSFLGEHFSPSLVLLWPMVAATRSPVSLLAVQAAAIALGGRILYALARERLDDGRLALALMAAYLASPFVQGAAVYDFHMDMLEPPMLFGLALALARGRAGWAWLCALLLWTTKEDTFLYTAVLGAHAALVHRRRRLGWSMALVGIAQAAVVLGVLLPSWREPYDPAHFSTTGPQQGYAFLFRYGHLGKTLPQMLSRLLNPLYVLDYLTSGPRLVNLLALLLSFGGLALLARWGLLLLLPTLEMLLGNPPLSTFSFYYGAVAFMFAPLAAIEGARNLLRERPAAASRCWRPAPRQLAVGLAAITLALLAWHPRSLLSSHHRYKPWVRTPHHALAEQLMARIPEGARVTATGYLAVHLQPGRDVRLFPYGLDRAEWVLVDLQRPPWPLSFSEVQRRVADLPRRGFALLAAEDGLLLLRRHAEGLDTVAEAARVRRALFGRLRLEAELEERTHFVDRVESSEGASGGHARSVGPGDRRGAGWLQYGPYARLPAGRYEARWRLRWLPTGLLRPLPSQEALTVDVVSGRGRRTLARRVLRAAELARWAGAWKELSLRFRLPSMASDLEARTRYHDLGTLQLDWTAIERLEGPAPQP